MRRSSCTRRIGDGAGDACDLCAGDDATGDGDGLCADLDCDAGDSTNSCLVFGDGLEAGNTSALVVQRAVAGGGA